MKRTKLLIATPSHSTAGGVERIIEALATGLPHHGFDVTVGLARGLRFHDPEKFRRAFPALKTVTIDGRSGTAYGRYRAVRQVIERTAPDIVLMARLYDVYPAMADLKRAGFPVRLAITIQAFETEYVADARRFGDFVDVCVTSGRLIARAVTALAPIPPDRVVSIPGGVRAADRQVFHDASAPLRIGYVGRLEHVQKRVLDIIALASALKDAGVPAAFTIAGTGSDERELRAALPQADFKGWLSTEDLYRSVYPNLDVLVHFAEWEGVTIAPREAMVHGVVPVISRFPGAELEGHFRDGINALTFPVGEVREAAAHIVELHRNRPLLERLSANARTSQGGPNSERGAIEAWARAFGAAMEASSRSGNIPSFPADHGLLSRLGVTAPIAEVVRTIRRLPHQSPGAEWPHWSGLADEQVTAEMARMAIQPASTGA